MKKYTQPGAVTASLFILLICSGLKSFSQPLNYDTTFNGWNAKVHLPWNYYQTQDSFQLIVFFPGLGEVGTDISKLLVAGPHKYLANGWNGNVLIGTDTAKFIIVSLQPPAAYPAESLMNTRLGSIRSVYRERSGSVHLTGLSHGGWCSTTFVTGDAYGGPYTYAGQIASVVEVQGVRPDDNSPYPNLFDNFANAGGRLLGFEQVLDGRDIPTRVNRMNSAVANSGIFVSTNFGGGGHCCWDNFYGGSSAPNNFTLDGMLQNIYQWMARQGEAGGGGGNQSPTANAGSNQTVTLPASSANLSGSGSDADGSITAWAWTKISGPPGSTITSPGSQNTSVTGLVQGTYVFRLTVTDDDAATGTDDVQVTVNAAQQGTADTIRVNVYGGSNPYGNSAWNNWNVSSGLTSSTFTNVNAQATTVTATISASQGVSDNGPGYGGTMCPPEVLRYTSFATSNRTLTLNNLDISATYDIIFYASRVNTGNGTIFTVGSLSDTVVTDNNKTITGDLTNIDPASNGTITINISRTNPGGFQYLNGFTLIKHGQAAPPVANAGSDVTTYMPKTSVQLGGSDITGTATTIQWSKLSGGVRSQEGTLSSATVLNPVISNIGVGNYAYELYVSNATGSDRDTVIVHGMPQKSRTPNPNYEKFILTPFDNEIYFTNIMSAYPTLNGGDTLVIGSNVTGVIQLYGDDGSGGWGGDSLYPVVVINPPGQQITIGGSFRINGQYIKVTGSGDAGIKYGLKLTGQSTSGFALPAKHSNIEIERCYILKGDNGIYAKSNIDSMNVLTYHPNWYFKKDWFHDNLFDSTGGESMYIGHTFFFDGSQPTSGYIPVKHDGLLIEKDSVRWAGWDGIQTSNALNVTVRNNYVYETGRALISNQLYGIILGGYSTGRVDSNEIHLARSAGIAVFGNDTVKVRGNKLDSCGYADIQTNGNAGSGLPFTAIYVNDNQASSIGPPSPPLKVVIDNNCIQKVSTYTNGAAIRSANGNGTTNAGYITNNTIQDAQGRALTNLIKSNTPGETISGNTLGSCTPQSPLVLQVNIYGGTNPYNNVEWNNWNVASGLTSPALSYTNGNASAVTATLTASQGISDNGSSYGGTMCPPEVLRYASFATSNRTLTIDNLNGGKSYDLEFYASRSNTGNSTVFTIGSVADTVVTDNNKTVTANFSAIAPDGTNKITISLARLSGATFQYLNGFKITENTSESLGSILSNQSKRVPVTKPTEEIHADLSIYPNPANNLLTIKYESINSGNVKVGMYDISGRVVKSQTFSKNQIIFQQRLHINSLKAGLYYLMISDDSGNRWVSKFLKL